MKIRYGGQFSKRTRYNNKSFEFNAELMVGTVKYVVSFEGKIHPYSIGS